MNPTAGEVAELLVALIRNACVNDGTLASGNEARSVETLESYLGVRGERIEPALGRVSVVFRILGDPSVPALMLMGHTDVVPAGSGWTVDPFSGDRADGFVTGRGAIDMLDQTAAMAAVYRRALSGALRYPGDLVFLAAADEEAGGKLGARHLVDEHWDLVDTDYLITEIATPALHGSRGVGIPVTVAEKGPHWRRLHSVGISGHGSQPYGAANALVPVAEAMWRLGTTDPGAVITDEWRRFVAAWDPPDGLAAELLDPNRLDDAMARIAEDDVGMARWIHACTHMTVSPNLMHAGVKANVVPDRAVAEVDVRTLPGQGSAEVAAHFHNTVGDTMGQLQYEEVESTPSGGSAPQGPLWDAIATAIASNAPGHHPIPAMIPVGTDARFFRPRGVVAYGVGLMDDRIGFGDFLRMFHGPDEKVSERSLGLTTDLYVEIIQRLGTALV